MIQPPGRSRDAICRNVCTGSGWCARNSRVKGRTALPRAGRQVVNVAGDDFHVAQADRGHRQPGTLHGRPAGIHADDPPGRPGQLRQVQQAAQGAAATIDHRPARLDARPAQRGPGRHAHPLRDRQQPPEVLIAAIQQVAMDTLPHRVSHSLPPHPPQRSRNKLMSAAFTHPRQRARGPLTGAGFSAGMADFDRAVFSGGVSFDRAAFPKCFVAFRGACSPATPSWVPQTRLAAGTRNCSLSWGNRSAHSRTACI